MCAARGKIILTLAVYTCRYFLPKFHEITRLRSRPEAGALVVLDGFRTFLVFVQLFVAIMFGNGAGLRKQIVFNCVFKV